MLLNNYFCFIQAFFLYGVKHCLTISDESKTVPAEKFQGITPSFDTSETLPPHDENMEVSPVEGSLSTLPTGMVIGLWPTGNTLGTVPTGNTRDIFSTDDALGALPTGDTLGTLPTGDTLGTLPTGDTLGTLPIGDTLGTLPTGDTLVTLQTGDTLVTLQPGDTMGTLPFEGTLGTWPTGNTLGTLSTANILGSFATGRTQGTLPENIEMTSKSIPTGGTLGILLTGVTSKPTRYNTDDLSPGKSTKTMSTIQQLSTPSFTESIEQSTSDLSFTLPPLPPLPSFTLPPRPVDNIFVPDFGVTFANLSDILKENGDLIESYAIELNSLCPHNSFMCYNKITSLTTPTSTSNCCVSCSCSDYCQLENTCCPTKTSEIARYENSTYFTSLFCQSTYKLLTEDTAFQLYLKRYKHYNGYYFVSSCPASASEDNRFLCEDMTTSDVYSVIDSVPVTDIYTNVHFANGFCAACHNIAQERTQPWDIAVSCLNDDTVLEDDIENFVRRTPDCFIRYVPPEGVSNSTLVFCQPVIGRCNTSGTWKTYDAKVESLCHDARLEQIYIVNKDFVEYSFKNVFCAICNGRDADHINNCMPVIVGPLNPTDLHALLTFSGENVAGMGFNKKYCPVGTVYIPVLESCKSVHCTSPYVVDILRNTCVLRSLVSQSVNVHIPILVSLNQSIPLFNYGELHNDVTSILAALYTTSCICDVFFVDELDTTYTPDMTSDSLLTTRVQALYISLHVTESTPHLNYDEYVTTVNTEHNQVIENLNVLMKFSYSLLDPLYVNRQTYIDSDMIVERNPYNGAALVSNPLITVNCNCSEKGELGMDYPLHFMECPSALISLAEFGVTRMDSGLRFGEKGVISFNEFRSVNSSHVYVCIDSMKKKVQNWSSRGNFIFDRYAVFLILTLHLLMILLW